MKSFFSTRRRKGPRRIQAQTLQAVYPADKYNIEQNGFFADHEPSHSNNWTVIVPGCMGCVLFRQRRKGGVVPLEGPCSCVGLSKTSCYRLNPLDCGEDSLFKTYRGAIIDQLQTQEAQSFFLACAFQLKKSPHGQRLDRNFFIYVLIDIEWRKIGGDNHNLDGVHAVRTVLARSLRSKISGGGDNPRSNVAPFSEWVVKPGRAGIGVAIDFRVLYPQEYKVYFGMQMGLQLQDDAYQCWVKESESQQEELSWVNNIFLRLSDSGELHNIELESHNSQLPGGGLSHAPIHPAL